jgi:diadenosine tetraphosphate (Ap4A) HIT family hydrolase
MFRNIAGLLMPVCISCPLPEPRFACANALAFAVRDTSPVTPLHSLNLPRRHVSSYFDVDGNERDAMLDQVRRGIVAQDLTVAGSNIGNQCRRGGGQDPFSLSHPPDPAAARRCCKPARQGPGRYSREAVL